jgi:Xaa-Pro aminopeptidase
MQTEKRLKKACRLLRKNKLDGILIFDPYDIFYLTGLQGIQAYLFVSPLKTILFTDFRYLQSLNKTTKEKGIKLVEYKTNIFLTIAGEIKQLSLTRIGFEPEKISFSQYNRIRESFTAKNINLSAASNIIENLREKKDRQEISLIRKSVNTTEKTLALAEEILYPGLSERSLAVEIEKALKLQSGDSPAFSPIVAAGKNSAEPHHTPGETLIKRNSPVLIDLGAKQRGYCADLTRVFFLSKMPLYIRKISDIVKKSLDLSIKKAKAGIRIKEIDKAARDYIEKKGYGKYFGHALGHGVGIQVHEKPVINYNNESLLKPGSVITLEPAIYLPGKYGIRYERMLLIKEKGAELIDEHI